MLIRKYQPTDCKYLTELFYQTVHSMNAKDYTQKQFVHKDYQRKGIASALYSCSRIISLTAVT